MVLGITAFISRTSWVKSGWLDVGLDLIGSSQKNMSMAHHTTVCAKERKVLVAVALIKLKHHSRGKIDNLLRFRILHCNPVRFLVALPGRYED